jgi:hypothetical protein
MSNKISLPFFAGRLNVTNPYTGVMNRFRNMYPSFFLLPAGADMLLPFADTIMACPCIGSCLVVDCRLICPASSHNLPSSSLLLLWCSRKFLFYNINSISPEYCNEND